jgi:hypothetical protein
MALVNQNVVLSSMTMNAAKEITPAFNANASVWQISSL